MPIDAPKVAYADAVTEMLKLHKACADELDAELGKSEPDSRFLLALTAATCGTISTAVALAWVARWFGEDKAAELARVARHYTDNGGDDFTLFNSDFDAPAEAAHVATGSTFEPNWTVRPGAHLKEWLDTNEVSVQEFARQASLDYNVVVQLLTGARRINSVIADALHRVTGITIQFWMNAETEYRRALARGLTDVG